MRKLYIVHGKAWNFENNVYIDFVHVSKETWFNAYILNGANVEIVDLNNYRVNGNVVKVNGTYKDDVSYIFDVDNTLNAEDKFTYWRCYFVNSSIFQSGFTTYNCEVDLWGTYLPFANVSNLSVTRCNRNIGNGIFDNITNFAIASDNDTYYLSAGGNVPTIAKNLNWLSAENVSIIFIANCVIENLTAGLGETTATFMFANSLYDIMQVYPVAYRNAKSPVELAVRCISNIIGLPTSGLTINKMEIVNAYIIPSNFLYGTSSTAFNFKFKCVYDLNEYDVPFYFVEPSLEKLHISLIPTNLDINKKWILGIKDEGIEILRSTKNHRATIDVTLNYDGLKVMIREGEIAKDLTHAFEISLVGSTKQLDKLEKIVYVIREVLGSLTAGISISSAVLSGNIPKAISSSANYEAGKLEKVNYRAVPSASISNADGFVTFDRDISLENVPSVNYPFVFTYYKSANDEEQNARLKGANFNQVIDWNEIYDYPVFYIGNRAKSFTFLTASAEISGIPTKAIQYIKAILQSGVYLGVGDEDNINEMT